jgi:hypothetical protein
MMTVTVLDKDSRGRLTFDLRDVLGALDDLTRDLEWVVSDCEARGRAASALDAVARDGTPISSAALFAIAQDLDQVIDGTFRGFAEPFLIATPQVILVAVDSTSWDISSSDGRVLDRIRARFHDVYEAGDVGYGTASESG